MSRFSYRVTPAFALALAFYFAAPWDTQGQEPIELPRVGRVALEPVAKIDFKSISESSGLVKSRLWENVFWTHNDSGDKARIFAIDGDGSIIKPEGGRDFKGIEIVDAVNIDWEDVATDDNGNLIIAACGNNGNTRRDLALYVVPEPHPWTTYRTRLLSRIPFHYPDQARIPSEERNFDCEAVFFASGKIYLLTKHRSDSNTKLYRVDTAEPHRSNALTLLGEFPIGGMVTAADATPDGRRLAVLTYNAIWMFELKDPGDDYFDHKVFWLPIAAKQCESICYDGDVLFLGNEQRDLYRVPIERLHEVRGE